jgi:hypothetical protein
MEPDASKTIIASSVQRWGFVSSARGPETPETIWSANISATSRVVRTSIFTLQRPSVDARIRSGRLLLPFYSLITFGSLADIKAWIRNVRFSLRSRHAWRPHPCLQSAICDWLHPTLPSEIKAGSALRIVRENATPSGKDRCVATGRVRIVGTRLSAKKAHYALVSHARIDRRNGESAST